MEYYRSRGDYNPPQGQQMRRIQNLERRIDRVEGEALGGDIEAYALRTDLTKYTLPAMNNLDEFTNLAIVDVHWLGSALGPSHYTPYRFMRDAVRGAIPYPLSLVNGTVNYVGLEVGVNDLEVSCQFKIDWEEAFKNFNALNYQPGQRNHIRQRVRFMAIEFHDVPTDAFTATLTPVPRIRDILTEPTCTSALSAEWRDHVDNHNPAATCRFRPTSKYAREMPSLGAVVYPSSTSNSVAAVVNGAPGDQFATPLHETGTANIQPMRKLPGASLLDYTVLYDELFELDAPSQPIGWGAIAGVHALGVATGGPLVSLVDTAPVAGTVPHHEVSTKIPAIYTRLFKIPLRAKHCYLSESGLASSTNTTLPLRPDRYIHIIALAEDQYKPCEMTMSYFETGWVKVLRMSTVGEDERFAANFDGDHQMIGTVGGVQRKKTHYDEAWAPAL